VVVPVVEVVAAVTAVGDTAGAVVRPLVQRRHM
jgi:hypothetical protein